MADTIGIVNKFVVWKNTDLEYLSHSQCEQIDYIDSEICKGRIAKGKPIHQYLVINTDEPYAQEVIDIMKKYGHWG